VRHLPDQRRRPVPPAVHPGPGLDDGRPGHPRAGRRRDRRPDRDRDTTTTAPPRNVTTDATWISSAPAKATVSAGFVTGVAAGTANVSPPTAARRTPARSPSPETTGARRFCRGSAAPRCTTSNRDQPRQEKTVLQFTDAEIRDQGCGPRHHLRGPHVPAHLRSRVVAALTEERRSAAAAAVRRRRRGSRRRSPSGPGPRSRSTATGCRLLPRPSRSTSSDDPAVPSTVRLTLLAHTVQTIKES
jgi:hypothetical protein